MTCTREDCRHPPDPGIPDPNLFDKDHPISPRDARFVIIIILATFFGWSGFCIFVGFLIRGALS